MDLTPVPITTFPGFIDLSGLFQRGTGIGIPGKTKSKAGLDLSPRAIKCTLSGIGTMALDYAGFIPGEGLAHSLFGIALGMVSTPLSAANGDTTGAFAGIAGIHLSALEMTGAQAIPWISFSLNLAQTIKDNNNIQRDYNDCMSGGS